MQFYEAPLAPPGAAPDVQGPHFENHWIRKSMASLTVVHWPAHSPDVCPVTHVNNRVLSCKLR